MLRLLLPALLPSWRFFASVGPAPRIEFALLDDPKATPQWQPLIDPVIRVSWLQSFLRLFWNPKRNEELYLVTCCERLLAERPDRSSFWQREILARVIQGQAIQKALALTSAHLVFRIVLLERRGDKVMVEVAFVSSFVSSTHEMAPLSKSVPPT